MLCFSYNNMKVEYTEFNSLFVLIGHEYQVMSIVKLPKSCSDVTGAQVHRHTGLDWRIDPRAKEHRGSPAVVRVLNRTDRDTVAVNGIYVVFFAFFSKFFSYAYRKALFLRPQ